ncbi:Importin-11, partial [Coemansia spiralis]
MDSSDSRQSIIEVLENATSQDPACMARAGDSLRVWETRPQFHDLLLGIFSDRTLSMPARLMAIITFKNGVDKYWKKTALHAIGLAEKELIRPRLLSMLDEDVPQIAVQYCVAVARIARWDFPM